MVDAVVVLFVPAALPWYYSWPLAVAFDWPRPRQAIPCITGLSALVMVITDPTDPYGMSSWLLLDRHRLRTDCVVCPVSVCRTGGSAGCNPGGQYAITWARRTRPHEPGGHAMHR